MTRQTCPEPLSGPISGSAWILKLEMNMLEIASGMAVAIPDMILIGF
jgi:hypothetical protein